jgi:hypothetical protein
MNLAGNYLSHKALLVAPWLTDDLSEEIHAFPHGKGATAEVGD